MKKANIYLLSTSLLITVLVPRVVAEDVFQVTESVRLSRDRIVYRLELFIAELCQVQVVLDTLCSCALWQNSISPF
jgi:hypothetical protein